MTRQCLLLLLLPAVAFSSPPVRAQPSHRPQIVRVDVGFGGVYKVGVWTPVSVMLRGGSEPATGRLSVIVPDGDGVPSRVDAPSDGGPIEIAPDEEVRIGLLVRFGRVERDARLTAVLEAEAEVLARRTFEVSASPDAGQIPPALPSRRRLIVVVGESTETIERVLPVWHEPEAGRSAIARVVDADMLPLRWCGYEGVDALVLMTSRPGLYDALQPGSPRWQAIDRWVGLGGKLLVCAGARSENLLLPGGPLADWIPGRLAEMVPLRQTGALESYGGGEAPVPVVRGDPLRVPRLTGVRGTVEAAEGGLPLVVRVSRGFGQIVFLAADLDQPPFGAWKDSGLLVAKLLDIAPAPPDEDRHSGSVMQHGYADLAGQLRSALDRFPGVSVVPFVVVAVLVCVYLLLIGPVDYFILRKLGRKMVLTWVTFPAIVVAVSLGAYLLANRLKGGSVRINQVDLVDVDTIGGRIRTTTWAGVFSPRMESYDFAVEPRLPGGDSADEAETLVAWFGMPGSSLGGMDPRTISPVQWTRPYRFSTELDALHEVPIPVSSSKSLIARWSADYQGGPGVESDLVDEDELPVGTVTNALPFALDDCVLAYGDWAFDLGRLEPGEAAVVGRSAKRSSLKTWATGRRLGKDQQARQTPYDAASTDPLYILRMMTLYDDVDGQTYTGLRCRYLGFVDLSGLLKTRRAVLLGSGPKGRRASRLLRDGRPLARDDDPHAALFRFVLPVAARSEP